MRSIHGVGELMTQVVLRGGGFLPTTPINPPDGDTVKTRTEPEKQDILVMDTKLKIIEILQVKGPRQTDRLTEPIHIALYNLHHSSRHFLFCPVVHPECASGLQDILSALYL